jgi:hypothetical protein
VIKIKHGIWENGAALSLKEGKGSAIDTSLVVSSSTRHGASDVLGCDIDIDMITKMLTSISSIIKTSRIINHPIC